MTMSAEDWESMLNWSVDSIPHFDNLDPPASDDGASLSNSSPLTFDDEWMPPTPDTPALPLFSEEALSLLAPPPETHSSSHMLAEHDSPQPRSESAESECAQSDSVQPDSPQSDSSLPKPLPQKLDIESCKIETGVTDAMIDRYLELKEVPDKDGVMESKWVCKYCNKKDNKRKENIRSHIQTHLGDRRYKCPVCSMKFVRSNDLTRHITIHAGDQAKRWKCPCGMNFARHDALSRHKLKVCPQSGTLTREGSARKRGRPKKLQPGQDNQQTQDPEPPRKRHRPNLSISSSMLNLTMDSRAPMNREPRGSACKSPLRSPPSSSQTGTPLVEAPIELPLEPFQAMSDKNLPTLSPAVIAGSPEGTSQVPMNMVQPSMSPILPGAGATISDAPTELPGGPSQILNNMLVSLTSSPVNPGGLSFNAYSQGNDYWTQATHTHDLMTSTSCLPPAKLFESPLADLYLGTFDSSWPLQEPFDEHTF